MKTSRLSAGAAASRGAGNARAAHAEDAPKYTLSDFSVGDKITHDEYGLGTVIALEDKGRNSVRGVDFGSTGTKRLMIRLAPVEKL